MLQSRCYPLVIMIRSFSRRHQTLCSCLQCIISKWAVPIFRIPKPGELFIGLFNLRRISRNGTKNWLDLGKNMNHQAAVSLSVISVARVAGTAIVFPLLYALEQNSCSPSKFFLIAGFYLIRISIIPVKSGAPCRLPFHVPFDAF